MLLFYYKVYRHPSVFIRLVNVLFVGGGLVGYGCVWKLGVYDLKVGSTANTHKHAQTHTHTHAPAHKQKHRRRNRFFSVTN